MGRDKDAADSYRTAVLTYSKQIDDIVEKDMKREASDIAAPASFFHFFFYLYILQVNPCFV